MMRSLAALLLLASLTPACGDDYVEPPGLCVLPVGESPLYGELDAWVTIVEFADFGCYYCAYAAPEVEALVDANLGDARLVFKHLPYHDGSAAAAIAAECAKEQDLFWEMHDILFTYWGEFAEADLQAYASAIDTLNLDAWNACREDPAVSARVDADEQLAYDAYVSGTPTFFVNGVRIVGARMMDLQVVVYDALDRALASGLPRETYYDSLVASEGCALDL